MCESAVQILIARTSTPSPRQLLMRTHAPAATTTTSLPFPTLALVCLGYCSSLHLCCTTKAWHPFHPGIPITCKASLFVGRTQGFGGTKSAS